MIYYIDIEAVPVKETIDELDERTKKLFCKKLFREIKENSETCPTGIAEGITWKERASLFAEFNKIVCVSLGTVAKLGADTKESIYIKSFIGDEQTILTELSKALEECYSLCAHFGKGFDYPVLCRKYVMNGLPLPHILDISGKKPWEIPLLDTQEMWKFGDMRHSCSLDLLANCFGLPSPKEEMDGSEVSHYYYNVPDGLAKIVKYCEADVRTLINVHRKMTYQTIIQ